MNDTRLSQDLADIKGLLREQSVRQQQTDIANESRMTRVEAGIAEIKADVSSIKQRGDADHDEIVQMRSQLAFRPAAAAIVSTIVSLTGAFFGIRSGQ